MEPEIEAVPTPTRPRTAEEREEVSEAPVEPEVTLRRKDSMLIAAVDAPEAGEAARPAGVPRLSQGEITET